MNGTEDKTAMPAGPIWVGGDLTVMTEDEHGRSYSILWLPDKNNDKLREANEPMVFYYLLDRSRLARDTDDHYKFHLQKFSGVMDPDKNIGSPGYAEVAGGYLNFSTTMKIPEEVIKVLRNKFKSKVMEQYENHPLLKFLDDMPEPNFRPAPITNSVTKLHTVSKRDNGSSGSSGNGQGSGKNIPAWGWDVQGAGKGSLNPLGTNAFSAMLGQFPVQLLEGAAKSGESNLTVENHLTYNAWAPVASIEVEGDWEAVYNHFSAAFGYDGWFTQADVQAEVNNLEKNGTIEVTVEYNDAFINKEQANKYEAAGDEIAQKFLKIAKESILNKEKPEVEAAKTNDGNKWLPNRQFSMKARFDKSSLSLNYEKKIEKKIERKSVQKTTLTGLYDEIKENEDAKDRYFSTVYLEEGFQKVHVVASSNANWGGENEEGDPINQLNIEVGYPDSEGEIIWKPTARFRDDPSDKELSKDGAVASWTDKTKERIYVFDFTKHEDIEGRDSGAIDIRKTVSFKEDPRVKVDEITQTQTKTDHILEVRAETAGHLGVGPISIDRPLNNDQITVLLTVRAEGVPEKTFKFTKSNQDQPRHFDAWYESPEDIPPYEYRVEVVVEGKTFAQAPLRWEGDWIEETGGGPLSAAIPSVPSDIQEKLQSYLSG